MILTKIDAFLKCKFGQKLTYELKSWLVTFVAFYGADLGYQFIRAELYSADFLFDFGRAVGVAFMRSLVIYLLAKVGINYRKQTADYK